jgi:polar amino acid transport system substrate-binding protein
MPVRLRFALAALAISSLALGACGDDDEPAATDDTSADDTSGTTGTDTSDTSAAAGACAAEDLPLVEDGVLTVATGEAVFEPWAVDDDPTNGQGFEVALVYQLASELGFAEEDVTWVRTGFDEAIAPGDKDYDFNVQQYSINEERDEVVDFSDGYYEVEQAIVARADSDLASATSISELQDAQLGAAIGSTSLGYIEDVIQPSNEASVFDDNAAAKAAFDAGQVDGLVFDVPTAYYITSVEIPDATIVGVLPTEGTTPEELGLLFTEGSELIPCVNEALAALRDDGAIDTLQEEWLNQGGDIPTLTAD